MGVRNWDEGLEHTAKVIYRNTPGLKQVICFGDNPVVSTTEEDIWNVGGDETLLTAGATMYISCEDNTNGVGQTFSITGLDENWDQQTKTVVLTGQTQAAIPGSWTRIFDGFQISANPDPTDNCWIAESDTLTSGVPDTATKIHGKIEYGDADHTIRKAMYTVPAGHKAMITTFGGDIRAASGGAARSAEVFIEAQFLALGATVASPSWAPFRRFFEGELHAPQAPFFLVNPPFPTGPFPQLTNIHIRAIATANSVIAGTMGMLLIKDGSAGS